MGNADVTTRRLFDKIDMEQTYPNSLTSRDINGFRIPIVMENDDLAIRFALHTITGANAASGYRAMWIRDTNHVQTFYVTERLLADKSYLESVYRAGAEKAAYVANRTLNKVYKKVGFLPR